MKSWKIEMYGNVEKLKFWKVENVEELKLLHLKTTKIWTFQLSTFQFVNMFQLSTFQLLNFFNFSTFQGWGVWIFSSFGNPPKSVSPYDSRSHYFSGIPREPFNKEAISCLVDLIELAGQPGARRKASDEGTCATFGRPPPTHLFIFVIKSRSYSWALINLTGGACWRCKAD